MRFLLPALAIGTCAVGAQDLPDSLVTPYTADQCPPCAGWNEPQAPFRLFGNSWYVGTAGLGAVLITSPDGHILIDGGLPDTAPRIAASIGTLGFDVADIRLIVNSHPHYDHAGGIAALQHLSGARVAGSAPTATVLGTGRSQPGDPQHGIAYDIPPVPHVEILRDGVALVVASLAITPHVTGGHTPGGTTWSWRSCEADRCLDLVYADSQTPVSADGFRFSQSARYPDAIADFRRAHALLETMRCDILVTPHPSQSALWERVERGELIDRDACRRYAAGAREALERRLEREGAAAGK
jgi:metallo-beta-lactamase class B